MPETQNIEYKESWRDEYIKWICGFANAQGGVIYIGKDDNGNVKGVQNAKKLLEDIPNKVRDILGIIPEINLLSANNIDVIEIRVEPSSFPISYKGEYHYRSGSTKQQLKGNALTQFLLKKTGLSWDSSEVSHFEMSYLSEIAFQIFRDHAIKSKRMNEEDVNISNNELLEKLNLFTENGKMTKAGFLMFAKDPEKRVIGSFIKIGYFEGAEILYQDEVKGSLLEQAGKTVDLIFTKYLKANITYEGVTRVETFPFAYGAIREAVYNAIVHRAYNCMNPTQIRIYKDKLIISNDAALSEDWTADKFMSKHKSVKYNPLIAATFFKAGFIESWGRGIEKMCSACKDNGNELPTFEVSSDDVTITFPALQQKENASASSDKVAISSDKVAISSDKNVSLIFNFLQEHESISNMEAQKILKMSPAGVRKIFVKLVNDGILLPQGKNKNRTYRLSHMKERNK